MSGGICQSGHFLNKKSNCSICPICEQERKQKIGFFSHFSAPARRALEANKIDSPDKLACLTEKELLKLHGIGKSSIPIFRDLLHLHQLTFKRND